MSRFIHISPLVLLAACAMAQPTNRGISAGGAFLDYQEAITQAEVKQGVDRRVELQACIKHWDALHIERIGLPVATSKDGSALLEIGNSGFPRYDYVQIDGSVLKSSFDAAVDISQSDLGRRLKGLRTNPLTELRGSANSEIDDSDCYYLTVIGGGEKRSIAVYGSLEATPSGALIRAILDEAQGQRK